MPTRRKTKVTKVTVKMPQGTEGENLTADQRRSKIDLMVADYEAEIEKRIAELTQNHEKVLMNIKVELRKAKFSIPKDILEMKVNEFIHRDNKVVMTSQSSEEEIANSWINTYDQKVNTVKTNSVEPMDTIAEEGENVPPEQPKRKKAGGKGRKRGIAGKPGGTNAKSDLYTPFRNQSNYRKEWATPAVTPKFDPRLPVTPSTNLRIAKPLERVMSMRGSPLAVYEDKPEMYLPLPNGEAIKVNEETISTLNAKDLTGETAEKIRTFYKALGRLVESGSE